MSGKGTERKALNTFWNELAEDDNYASPAQKMLLMDDPEQAALDDKEDLRELLALVPQLPENARILELAAGNGRVTEHLAPLGRFVMACDFVESFCEQNRQRCLNLGLKNVEVVWADAAHFTPPKNLDLVLANWLFMYLSDEETRSVFAHMAAALKPGGFLLFRESCDTTDEGLEHTWQAYDAENPARYRSLRWYTEALAALPVAGKLVRPVDILPLWSPPEWSTLQAAWLWQRAPEVKG